MNQEAIQAIESNIREAKKLVEFGASLERLQANRDFKKVILDGYFAEEAIRLVHLKSDPNMQSADSQKAIIAQMDSIGAVRQYLDISLHRARMALKAISSDEETLDEIRAEGSDA